MTQRKRWSEFEIVELLSMLKMDMTIVQIARSFMVSRQAIYKLMRRRYIEPNAYRPSWSKLRKNSP